MSKEEKVKNIIAFLSILFGEDLHCHERIMEFSPDYIIEKFERYVLSQTSESQWGIHPIIKRGVLDVYCNKWGLQKMNELERQNHSYLGDCVYAEFDGEGIWLRTGDHRDAYCDNRVYLEPSVLNSLYQFALEKLGKKINE